MLIPVSKIRETYICSSCGTTKSQWMGKCPDCGQWDSLEPHWADSSSTKDPHKGLAEGWVESSETQSTSPSGSPVATPITSIDPGSEIATRISSGIAEFDRVLGGGIVPGSAILVGGDPGIGKSTLLLQAAAALANSGSRILYVSSEESASQIRLRAERLAAADSDDLFLLADTNLARIIEQARKVKPAVMVIDSVQMVYKGDLDASPGSVTQLRRCCSELVYLAKASGIAVVLIGHVTKEGVIAGPRLLEHLVDAVLYFEGDRYHAHRIIRGIKNRYGTTHEIGIFEMTGSGLRQAPGGAGVVATNGPPRPGSVVCPVMSGSRCVLVEMQALTATGFLGSAKRKASGIDTNRLAMLIAVLEQHAGLRMADRDIFASSVGGIKVIEPAADLALLLAIAGAHYKRALAESTAAVGEVGLGGEIRQVNQLEQRINEAARLGYKRIIIPNTPTTKAQSPSKKVELIPAATIGKAIEELG